MVKYIIFLHGYLLREKYEFLITFVHMYIRNETADEKKNPGPIVFFSPSSSSEVWSEDDFDINLRINLEIFNLHEDWRCEDCLSGNFRRCEDLKTNSQIIFEDMKISRSVFEMPSRRCFIFEDFFNRIFKSSNLRRFTFIRPVGIWVKSQEFEWN